MKEFNKVVMIMIAVSFLLCGSSMWYVAVVNDTVWAIILTDGRHKDIVSIHKTLEAAKARKEEFVKKQKTGISLEKRVVEILPFEVEI